MAKPKRNRREKRWNLYRKSEQENKKHFLKSLSETDGFKILEELYNFAYGVQAKQSFNKSDMAKIKVLSSMRSVFGRIQA